MNCLYSEHELQYDDYYGKGNPLGRGFKKTGDIYKCSEESCEGFEKSFHTDTHDNLSEGYPC